MSVAQEVKEVLLEIADNIERLGHYQGEQNPGPDTSCCIVANPAYQKDSSIRGKVIEALGYNANRSNVEDLYKWNDNTPTEEVLAKIRSVANGD